MNITKVVLAGITALFCLEATLAQRMITGKVIDADTKKPIPNATIKVIDTDSVTRTNDYGYFRIGADTTDFLSIECKGYEQGIVEVPKKDNMQFALTKRVDEQAYFGGEVRKQASFRGGWPAFKQYLKNNTRYPAEIKPGQTKGPVVLSFTIDITGEIVSESIEVIKGISPACDKEAVRLLKESPNWIPARQGNTPVTSELIVEISFKR
ncbi:MAG TPA: energy transducer TonB [Ohtaekwangia sp.]